MSKNKIKMNDHIMIILGHKHLVSVANLVSTNDIIYTDRCLNL